MIRKTTAILATLLLSAALCPSAAFASNATWDRLAGSNALGTMYEITETAYDLGACDTVIVATVEGYWDGLVGAPLCGRNKAPLILARPEDPSTATNGFVSAHANAIEQGYVLGGTSAVPDAVKSALEAATK